MRTLLSSADTNERANAGNRLATEPAAAELTLALLAREQNAKVMSYSMMNIYATKHFYRDRRVREVLRYILTTHREPAVVALALEQLRSLAMRDLQAPLTERLEDARKRGDDAMVRALASWAREP